MMQGEKIAGELNEALDALQGEGTGGARLAAALRRIERQTGPGQHVLAPVAEALERVLAETNAARATIEQALAATAFEPEQLERDEERLFALRAAARKHKVSVDDLPELVIRLETELARSRPGRIPARGARRRRQGRARSLCQRRDGVERGTEGGRRAA